MPRLARHIHLEAGKIEIDGEEFPFLTRGIRTENIRRDEVPAVIVTIPAELVTVNHELPGAPRDRK